MPTKKLQSHVIAVLVTALAALLVSCPAGNPPANTSAQSAVQSSSSPTTSTGSQDVVAEKPDPGPSNAGTEDAVDEPVAEESGSSQEASGGDEKEEGNEEEAKPPMSKNYRAPEEPSRRPPKKPRRKKSLVSVEMRLIGAEYNAAEDATLSKLTLEFRANLDRMKREIKVVELDDINKVVVTEFDLGLCKIEIYPIVQPPNLDDVGSLGSIELLFSGTFQVRLYLEGEGLVGIFGIYADGTFGAAPWNERPEGYLVKSMKREDSYLPAPFTVYRETPVGEKPEYLITIQYNAGGFSEQTVDDPKGHRYKYRFPAGVLELYDPNEI